MKHPHRARSGVSLLLGLEFLTPADIIGASMKSSAP
jgi:hypothetical protein